MLYKVSLPEAYRRICRSAYNMRQRDTNQEKQDFQDVNMPRVSGKMMHLGLKEHQVANRIVTVGHLGRLKDLVDHLDQPPWFECTSERGFVTVTGEFQSIPVSIVCIGMGYPNMDFFLREAREVVEGKMAIIRFGSCGGIHPSSVVGSLAVSSPGSVMVKRNPDAFRQVQGSQPVPDQCPHYSVMLPALSDPVLSDLLYEELQGKSKFALKGMNISADSFYSSQGRPSKYFDDCNAEVMSQVKALYPDALTMEMETFHLLDLASNSSNSIVATAVSLVLANRHDKRVIDMGLKTLATHQGSSAVLNAITRFQL